MLHILHFHCHHESVSGQRCCMGRFALKLCAGAASASLAVGAPVAHNSGLLHPGAILDAMAGPKPEAEGCEGSQGRHSRLDAEQLSYYAEIDTHFKGLTDDEDKHLLANNVLGDAAGREAEVATDAACSRVVEALLPFASTEALCTFTNSCVEGDSLGTMCTRWVGGWRRAAAAGSGWRRRQGAQMPMAPAIPPLLTTVSAVRHGPAAAAPLARMCWRNASWRWGGAAPRQASRTLRPLKRCAVGAVGGGRVGGWIRGLWLGSSAELRQWVRPPTASGTRV